MSEPGPSTSQSEASSNVDVDAATLLSQGRRHLLVGDAVGAVQCLQEASALLGAKYGELANECGESYYYYGWALLELARMETGVLGNALDGVPEEEQAVGDGAPDNIENPDKVEDEGAGPSVDKTDDDEGEVEGEVDEDAEGDDEDVPNFQLSWEMLELARVIFTKQESKESKLKLSQVFLKLGELGLETGQYEQSTEDFTVCLANQKEQLDSNSRLLAETYYNLALAYSFDLQFDHAIENFEESMVVIQNRIAMLKKKAETEDKATAEDLEQNQKEVKELEVLIPEIKAKIEDAKAEKNTADSAVGQAMTSAAAEFGLGSSSSSSSGFPCSSSTVQAKPIAVRKAADTKVGDVSHLVHRKRKPEEELEQDTSGKKCRQEEGGSGDATMMTTTTNGSTMEINGSTTTNGVNGTETVAMNGDAKDSPEKPEIMVKQLKQTTIGDSDVATMET